MCYKCQPYELIAEGVTISLFLIRKIVSILKTQSAKSELCNQQKLENTTY